MQNPFYYISNIIYLFRLSAQFANKFNCFSAANDYLQSVYNKDVTKIGYNNKLFANISQLFATNLMLIFVSGNYGTINYFAVLNSNLFWF